MTRLPTGSDVLTAYRLALEKAVGKEEKEEVPGA